MKKYVLICCSMLLFACNSVNKLGNQNSNSVDISLNTWILDNQEIKSLLSDYIHAVAVDEYSKGKNSFIEMQYRFINDSTYSYTLWESIDITPFIYSPVHIIFQFEQKLVCCYIFGLEIFRINDDFLVKFMKKNYPRQYNYYLKYGDYPPPPTGGGLVWELIFQNGHLISKKVYYTE